MRQLRPSVRLPIVHYQEAARYGGKGGAKLARRAQEEYGSNLLDVEVRMVLMTSEEGLSLTW